MLKGVCFLGSFFAFSSNLPAYSLNLVPCYLFSLGLWGDQNNLEETRSLFEKWLQTKVDLDGDGGEGDESRGERNPGGSWMASGFGKRGSWNISLLLMSLLKSVFF